MNTPDFVRSVLFTMTTMAFLELLLHNYYRSSNISYVTRVWVAAAMVAVAVVLARMIFGIVTPINVFFVTALLVELPIALITRYQTVPFTSVFDKMIIAGSFAAVSWVIGKLLSDLSGKPENLFN